MGTNEEYLDRLLQSVENEEGEIKHTSHEMTDEELMDSLINMYGDELAEFKKEEVIHKEEVMEDAMPKLEESAEDMSEEEIDRLLEAATSQIDSQIGEKEIEMDALEETNVSDVTETPIMSDELEDLEAKPEKSVTESIDEKKWAEVSDSADMLENIENKENIETEMNLESLLGTLNFDNESQEAETDGEKLSLDKEESFEDDLTEINQLLQSLDNHETSEVNPVFSDDIGGNDLLNELLQINSDETDVDKTEKIEEEKPQKKKKEKKEKKVKESKEKKESFWKKITDILFEEDSLDEEQAEGEISIDVDGEDIDVLEKLMKESNSKEKKKEKKGDKKKKSEENAENLEEGYIDPTEQAKQEKLKAKAEKKAAKKKEKEEKKEADKAYLKAQPSISSKRAFIAFVFALSILGIIVISYIYIPDAMDTKNARKAYYNKDYYSAYELLCGKELNDSDKILYEKVTCILKMQRKLDSYNNYVAMGMELEGLNALAEGVKLYEECYSHATALSIQKQIDAVYNEIVILLNGKYNVDVQTIQGVNKSVSNGEYTQKLQYILEGKEWDNGSKTEDSEPPMEDILPEEEDFWGRSVE